MVVKKSRKAVQRFQKCPWCGRRVEVRRGRLFPHMERNMLVRCLGNGQPVPDAPEGIWE